MAGNLPTVDQVRREARAWILENWSPDRSVREWWAALAESGWGFPTWPEEWFGRGLDADRAQVVNEEILAVGALGPPHGIGQTMGAPAILQYGTEAQKRKFLPVLASGEEAWCQFFSEPDAGSDLASLRTRAERDGDEWSVNGQKVWNSGTITSERGLLPVRTDPDVPKHRGISFFIIEVDQPGIEVNPIKQMNGEAHFNHTFFNDAKVSGDDLLGELNGGWQVVMATLSFERTAYAAGADYRFGFPPGERSGMLDLRVREALVELRSSHQAYTSFPLGDAEALIDLAREHGCFDDCVIRQRIMSLYCLTESARLTGLRAKANSDAGKAPGPESSILHLAGVAIARATRDLGLGIIGAGGMLLGEDAPRQGAVAMMALTSLVHGIQGGSEQIQRNIIGERSLGLPREPQVDRDKPFRDILNK